MSDIAEEVHIWIGEEHVSANPTRAAIEQSAGGPKDVTAPTPADIATLKARVQEEQRYQSITKRLEARQVRGNSGNQALLGIALALIVFLAGMLLISNQRAILSYLGNLTPNSTHNVAAETVGGSETSVPTSSGILTLVTPQASQNGAQQAMATPLGIGSTGLAGVDGGTIIWTPDANGAHVDIQVENLNVPCVPAWSSPLPTWQFTEANIKSKIVSERAGCYASAGYNGEHAIIGWYGPTDWILVKRPKVAEPKSPSDWEQVWITSEFIGIPQAEVQSIKGAKDYMPAQTGQGMTIPTSVPVDQVPVQAVPTTPPQPLECTQDRYNAAAEGIAGYAVGCDGMDALLAVNPGMKAVTATHAGVLEFLQMKARPDPISATEIPITPTVAPNIGSNGEPCNPGNAAFHGKITDTTTGLVGLGYSCVSQGAAFDMAQADLDAQLARLGNN